MTSLTEYAALPHRWVWGGVGGHDCTTFCARWVEIVTGKDPGAGLIGTYSSREDANALIASHGGIERMLDERLARVSVSRTEAPRSGDVGLISTPVGFDATGITNKQIPAIRFGPLWLAMSARGPVAKQATHSAAWRIE
ncbi:hypothetical protein ASG25_01985 [Rhizobium sp. Leaf384]|uniref:DUF6950 family protein n=1 Tax=unclassified Rhizobium TaxID=2613769 RepID=UPI00071544B3|nr:MULTISPECIES: hypothetical protein [unclassified Rhizobium]KQS74209.1 hypothetical protein ASG58_17050 [Rhizobium sp. Leaf383]KQS80404.1 hypothetical protein ASG25_01985 [Rhizobium sp. Leaf384]